MTTSDPRILARQDPAASRSGAPTLAVVIASSGARGRLPVWVPSLAPECLRSGIELIIARADAPGAMSHLSAAYPYARFVWAPPRTTIPELRRAGLTAASADVVALIDETDDRAVPDQRWLERLRWRRLRDAESEREHQLSAPEARTIADPTAPDGAVQLVPYPSPLVVDTTLQPYLSVVVPVHQGGDVLRHSLEALSRSDVPRTEWELIVVDDASTDETALVAAGYADMVIRLPGRPRGPAYARNRGFEFARGEYLAFVDPEVCVHRDALAHFILVLSREPEVSAVFGSFDANPAASGLISQYRNLLAHYYHQEYPGPAETFWASCGAIRRNAFAAAGMFDEWKFSRAQVEDFELGYQLRERGHRVILRPEIQATSLKRWTLRALISADLQDRGVPWMRIFPKRDAKVRRRKMRLRLVKSVNTALTWLAVILGVSGVIADRPWLLVGASACLLSVILNGSAQHRFFARERGVLFALAVVPLQLLSYLVNGMAVTVGWMLRELLGEPTPNPTVEAFAEMGVTMWPPVPVKRRQATSGAAEVK